MEPAETATEPTVAAAPSVVPEGTTVPVPTLPFTVCVMGPAVPMPYVESPEYLPTMAWLPEASDAVVQVALPPETATLLHSAMTLLLSRNVTLPDGVPELPLMAAVKVTALPALVVYEDEARVAETLAVPVAVVVVPPLPVPVEPEPDP